MKNTQSLGNEFHYHDLVIKLHPEVYDPAEDTFLLLEALTFDNKKRMLELGTGCGLIGLVCAYKGLSVVCTDINPFAVELTQQNVERNKKLLKACIEVRQGNLFSVVQKNERFDVIVFNPPYLPTKKQEKIGGWFDVATDGGPDGLRITKRFIHGFKKFLSSDGRAYFIFSSLSNRSTLERYFEKETVSFEIVASRKFDGEELDVYCVAPTD
jgi:release factor glutamine methyltransferase